MPKQQRKSFFKNNPLHKTLTREERLRKISRSELYDLTDQVVRCSGELSMNITRKSKCDNLLLSNLVVNGDIYIDHAWISIKNSELIKLTYAQKFTRIYFTATVIKYTGTSKFKTRMGLAKLKLVQTL
jgi:hypothetical protein